MLFTHAHWVFAMKMSWWITIRNVYTQSENFQWFPTCLMEFRFFIVSSVHHFGSLLASFPLGGVHRGMNRFINTNEREPFKGKIFEKQNEIQKYAHTLQVLSLISIKQIVWVTNNYYWIGSNKNKRCCMHFLYDMNIHIR